MRFRASGPPMTLATFRISGSTGLPTSSNPFSLAPARMHEAEGSGRRAFAVFQALRHPGPLVWILQAHALHRPLPPGLPDDVSARLHLLTPRCETDLLWAVEETLRAAPVGLVIAEPLEPLSLTVGRRLQLAAKAGTTTGLILVQDGHGSPAAETRWTCAPAPLDERASTGHIWRATKNKKGTTGTWVVDWDGASAAFDLVPAAGKRSEPAAPAR